MSARYPADRNPMDEGESGASAPELLAALYQYRDDLRYPPQHDSKERRIEMVEALIAKASGAGAPTFDPPGCRVCDGGGWTCENHPDLPWDGTSNREDACHCGGAGAPCGACNLKMAAATYSEPWRELADRAIGSVESAVRETSWGQPTFGPDEGEELRAAYGELITKATGSIS